MKLQKITIEAPQIILEMLQGSMIGSLAMDITEKNFPDKEQREKIIHAFQKNLLEVESAMLAEISREEIKEKRQIVFDILNWPKEKQKKFFKDGIDDLLDQLDNNKKAP